MPGPLAPVLIGAAAGLAGTGINAAQTGSMNKKTRQWQEQMYARQRQDALSDWERQNQYNSPQQQMQRYKEAGLNPHLIYGQMSNSPSIRSSDTGSWNPQVPNIDLGRVAQNALATYNDFQIKQAQTDNLKAAYNVASQEALLKAAQTAESVQRTAREKFTLQQAEKTQLYVVKAAELANKQAEANINKTITETEKVTQGIVTDVLMRQPNFNKALSEIDAIRAQTSKSTTERYNIQQDTRNKERQGILQQLEIDLREKGINPNDPMYMRILGQAIDKPFDQLKNWWNNIWKK